MIQPGAWRPGGRQHIPRPAGHRLGEHDPWPEHGLSVAAIEAALDTHTAADVRPARPESRPSAVLCLLHQAGADVEVLLTKRSADLRHHRGEIAFPGGRLDAGETFEVAALREASEEVGLRPEMVRLLGRLDPINTLVSLSYIVPVIAVAPERPPVAPASAEVDAVLWVPLAELTRADTFRRELWGEPPDEHEIFFFELDSETVWGATARVLTQLLRVAYGPPKERTAT